MEDPLPRRHRSTNLESKSANTCHRCAEKCSTLRYGWSPPSAIERAQLFPSGMRPDSLEGQPGIFFRRRRIESLCLRHLQTRAMGSEAHPTTRRRLHRSYGFLSRPGFVLGPRSPHNSGSPGVSGRHALPLAGTCTGPHGPARHQIVFWLPGFPVSPDNVRAFPTCERRGTSR